MNIPKIFLGLLCIAGTNFAGNHLITPSDHINEAIWSANEYENQIFILNSTKNLIEMITQAITTEKTHYTTPMEVALSGQLLMSTQKIDAILNKIAEYIELEYLKTFIMQLQNKLKETKLTKKQKQELSVLLTTALIFAKQEANNLLKQKRNLAKKDFKNNYTKN